MMTKVAELLMNLNIEVFSCVPWTPGECNDHKWSFN